MPRRGSKLSPEAKKKNTAATAAWHAENTEILKFSIRVRKGRAGAYRELAARRGQSLTGIIREYLDAQCEKENIDL